MDLSEISLRKPSHPFPQAVDYGVQHGNHQSLKHGMRGKPAGGRSAETPPPCRAGVYNWPHGGHRPSQLT